MVLFKLISVYEVIIKDQNLGKPVRIEIFQSNESSHIYRPRVWVRNTYNVYPMAVNTGSKGEDLHIIHSSDDFNTEISVLIAEDDSFFNGKYYDSEEELLEYMLDRVKDFYSGEPKGQPR